ncbi:MAG: hypothetical protein DRQ57_15510, partial [Gammaproteobacteria bacterium]
MKKTYMYLVLVVVTICLPSYVQAGIEDLKISLKPVMNENTGNKVELTLENTGSETSSGNLTLDVPRQWGVKQPGYFEFKIVPGKTIKKNWTFKNALNNPYNKYVVRVKISSKGNEIEKQVLIKGKKSASVNLGEPRSSKEISASIFGTQTHGDRKETLPLIEKAGLKWTRNCIGWPQVEVVKGELKVPPRHEEWVNDAVSRGINVNMILAYQNKHYPFADFEKFKEGYANYCAFMAKSLKGKVKVWEIWNEPHIFMISGAYGGAWNAKEGKDCPWMQKFTDLVIAAAKAIREVDPNVVIITGGGNPAATHQMLAMLKAKEAVHLLDGISLHPYPFKTPPEIQAYGGKIFKERDGILTGDEDNSYSSMVRLLKEKMKSVGMKSTDIYVTEFGYTTYHRTEDTIYIGVTLATQAKYLTRMFIAHLVHGIKVAIQYDFQDDGTCVREAEHNFGMVEYPSRGYKPKPSYYAVQRLCSLLSSPVELNKSKLPMAVIPDRHLNSKAWAYFEPTVVWDGAELQPLGNVQKHLFKNGDKELILVLWNAIRTT